MKILMDCRNHGVGTNSSSPCGLNGCGNVYLPISFCGTVKVSGYNPKNSSNV